MIIEAQRPAGDMVGAGRIVLTEAAPVAIGGRWPNEAHLRDRHSRGPRQVNAFAHGFGLGGNPALGIVLECAAGTASWLRNPPVAVIDLGRYKGLVVRVVVDAVTGCGHG